MVGKRHGLMFATVTGRSIGITNARHRILASSVARANERLMDPIPVGITPHSLRRTFASILFAVGEPPPYVMAQLGHRSPNLTLAIYARVMDRRDGEPDRLRALVGGDLWHASGGPGVTRDPSIPAPRLRIPAKPAG
jgi:integrase